MTDEIKVRIEQVKHGGIPEGYENKFGLSPAEWKIFSLKSLCKKRSEKNKDMKYDIVLSNTAAHGVIRQSDYFKKDIANEDNINTYFVVKDKDFVYNPRTSTLAPYGPIHSNDLNFDGVVSPLYTVFFLQNERNITYQYLKFYFDSPQWNKYVYSVANYGARYDRMNIGDKDFFDLPIFVPEQKEQQKIAEILSHCNVTIIKKKDILEEERKLKIWLMQNLLTPDSGVRLKSFEGKWKCVKLSKIGKISGAGIDKIVVETEECVTLLNYLDVYRNTYLYKNMFSHKVTAKKQKIEQCRIEKNDIFFTPTSETPEDIAKSAVAMEDMNDVAYSYHVVRLRPEKSFNSLFIKYACSTEDFFKQTYRLSEGSGTRYVISLEDFRILCVLIPPTIEEQTAIANILSAQDEKISLLEQELNGWEQKKKSLMQLLLTGIARVKI